MTVNDLYLLGFVIILLIIAAGIIKADIKK